MVAMVAMVFSIQSTPSKARYTYTSNFLAKTNGMYAH